MSLNDNELRLLIEKILIALKSELIQEESVKENLYIVLGEDWNSNYASFFEITDMRAEYNVFTVVSEKSMHEVSQFKSAGQIVLREDITIDSLVDFVTLFPIVTKDIISKVALCISDTFETRWVESCIAKGQKIIFRESGIPVFTGKEPKSYVKKISGYYEDIISYGIEISDVPQTTRAMRSTKVMVSARDEQSKKVITENDLSEYIGNKVLKLQRGDVITSLAKEKAHSMGIDIIYD